MLKKCMKKILVNPLIALTLLITHNSEHFEKRWRWWLILLVGFDTVSFLLYVLQYSLFCSSYFQGKPICAVRAFTMGNYPRQPAVVVYLFVKSVNLSLLRWNLNLTSLKTSVLLRCLIRSQLLKYSGVDPEILKRGGALCGPPWLADKENIRFQMV